MNEDGILNLEFKNEEEQFESCKRKIVRILQMAMETDFYSEAFKNIDIDNISYRSFSELPILTKEDLKQNMFRKINKKFTEFDVEEYQRLPYEKKRKCLAQNGMELRVTSGSTGVPVEVIKSKGDLERDYLMLNLYRRKLTTFNFKGSFLWVWPVNPFTRKYFYPDDEAERFWSVNKYGMQYMMYTYSDENLHIMYNYIIENNTTWLTISPSALMIFIEYMEREGLKIPKLKYIECHSEYLHEWQRVCARTAFGCDIVSIYSSNEVQFIAGANQNNKMRLFEGNCFLEFLENEQGSKNIYVTSLSYRDIPIVRYKLGDCGDWCNNSSEERKRIYEFELKKYRENDYIIGKNGTKYEPFILTDSIIVLQNCFDIKINKYKIKQVGIFVFEYYFDNSIGSFDILKAKEMLEEFLFNVFEEKVFVCIHMTNMSDFFFNGSKMKYIEVDKKILEDKKRSRGGF